MERTGKGKLLYRDGKEIRALKGKYRIADDSDLIEVETEQGIGYISKASLIAIKPLSEGGPQ